MANLPLWGFVFALAILIPTCVGQNTTATCKTGSVPFPLPESKCPDGFYCPFDGPPTFCSPTPSCAIDRLKNKFCEPQGSHEPTVCPKGYYCPTPKEMIKCPKGYYCPTGSVDKIECEAVSICREGAVRQRFVGALVTCIIIDAALAGLWFLIRHLAKKYEAKQAIDTKAVPMADKGAVPASPKPSNGDHVLRVGSDENIGMPRPPRILQREPSLIMFPALVQGFEKARNNDNLSLLFEFDGLSITLPTGKKILQGVTGAIRPGRVTAIMGPSGAGKTTFMNCLMGKVKRTGGTLRINNDELEMDKFKQLIGYVPQDDIMISELTVKENIRHSARVRLPTTWSDKEVDDFSQSVVEALDLAHVGNSEVGDHLKRGVSGGQKKRTNIGMELAAAPLAIFLDEPTSGLDSTAALKAAQILKQIASLGVTIVAVIHQPRQEIFDSFDDLLMIAPGGITAYLGPREGVVEYFKRQGFEFNPMHNQADILMDILSGKGKKVDAERGGVPYVVADILETWKRERDEINPMSDASTSPDPNMFQRIKSVCNQRGARWWKQILICHNRSIVQQYRLAPALVLEVGVALLTGVLLGIATVADEQYQGILRAPYTALSPSSRDVSVPLNGLLFGMATGLAGAPAGVKAFGEEMHVFLRESQAGHNRMAYYIGKTFSMLQRLTLAALHFATIYHVIAKPLTHFRHIFAIAWLFFFCVYGVAGIVSMLVRRENAPLLGVVISLFAAVFNGFGPKLSKAQSWNMEWFWDILYARWLTEGLYTEEVYPYRDVYDVNISAGVFGYTLNRFAFDMGMAFLVGLAFRIIGAGLLLVVSRRKVK